MLYFSRLRATSKNCMQLLKVVFLKVAHNFRKLFFLSCTQILKIDFEKLHATIEKWHATFESCAQLSKTYFLSGTQL